MKFEFDAKKMTDARLNEFAESLRELSSRIGFRISSRGWCYQLEMERLINKDQFDRVESMINTCRKKGILPVDFVAEEEGRKFSGIENPESRTTAEYLRDYLNYPLRCENWYTPDWWDGEEYYVQTLVEKIDLKTLFEPVSEKYKIPISTSKGWSSILQRAEYARRFKEAEDNGLKPLLLYCGDHDPDGLRISEFIKSNLEDIKDITWADGTEGFNPENLKIVRFGLDAPFIKKHKLTWIDNLITGSKKDLASPSHKNYRMPYVQNYLAQFGARKCEANAIVPMPTVARKLYEDTILSFLGEDAVERFAARHQEIKDEMQDLRVRTGLKKAIEKAQEELTNLE